MPITRLLLLDPGDYPHATGQLRPFRVHDLTLPGDAIVVRSGSKDPERWKTNAEESRKALLQYGIDRLGCSALAGEAGVMDLITEGGARGKWMCVSTARRIDAAGFSFQLTGRARHCSIWLPDTSFETLDSLFTAFDDPQPMPTPS